VNSPIKAHPFQAPHPNITRAAIATQIQSGICSASLKEHSSRRAAIHFSVNTNPLVAKVGAGTRRHSGYLMPPRTLAVPTPLDYCSGLPPLRGNSRFPDPFPMVRPYKLSTTELPSINNECQLRGGQGGGRTHTPFGHTILSRARLPVPPLGLPLLNRKLFAQFFNFGCNLFQHYTIISIFNNQSN
jgi:hypothetical protein